MSAPRWAPTGRFYRDECADLGEDLQGRRALMMKAGFKVKADRDRSGHRTFSYQIDEAIAEHLTSRGGVPARMFGATDRSPGACLTLGPIHIIGDDYDLDCKRG